MMGKSKTDGIKEEKIGPGRGNSPNIFARVAGI